MSARWARAVLATYRWAGAAAYPFLGSYMASRAGRGRDERSRRRERYGYSRIPRPAGPLVWIHAAGEAETAAVIGLVDTVLMHGIKVVLTTGYAAEEAQHDPLEIGGRPILRKPYKRSELAVALYDALHGNAT